MNVDDKQLEIELPQAVKGRYPVSISKVNFPQMDTSPNYVDQLFQLNKDGKIDDQTLTYLVGQWKDFIYDSGIRNNDEIETAIDFL